MITKRLFLSLMIIFYLVFCNNAVANTHSKNTHKNHTAKKHGHHKKTKKASFVVNNSSLKYVYINAQPTYLKSYASSLLNQSKNSNFISLTDPREAVDNSSVALDTPFKQLSWPEIAGKIYTRNNKSLVNYRGYVLELSLDPQLQAASERFLDQDRIVNGATVIIEPKTGRILALAQSGGIRNAYVSVTSRAPAASLMKIITASASIEKEKINPDDEIYFRGGCGYLRNENWMLDPTRDIQKITFAKAFGSSCNTVFGRLALYEAGLSSLKIYAEKFMFNKPIPSDIKIQTSMFLLPDLTTATPQEVAEAGAGFGATKLSPIHAALLSATIGNGGVMMAPYLVEAAYNSSGQEVYRAKPLQIEKVVSRNTAFNVEKLMLATISSGTSRKAFHRLGTRGDIDEIGGKTGTLLDPENRDMLYTWFSGIAPLNAPNSIAIGTVVASLQNWVVRASSVAQNTLAEYLKIERREVTLR
ncbi:MAG: penicillin-binding transpeptidase domain-containing protein [Bdellovibrionota bacterium]